MKNHGSQNIIVVETHKVLSGHSEPCADSLSVEEPLEIRVAFWEDPGDEVSHSNKQNETDENRRTKTIAVTMRTPGCDEDLAVGFLFAEGILKNFEDIESVSKRQCGSIVVYFKPHVKLDLDGLERHSFINSSCGVCGKKSIAAVLKRMETAVSSDGPLCKSVATSGGSSCKSDASDYSSRKTGDSSNDTFSVPASVIPTLARSLRLIQSDFDTTGGIHASALFTSSGRLLEVREDVGRHNALDKLIGAMLKRGSLPLKECILLLSGRASFELIQKAVAAGLPVVAAVGAPSSLAVQLASEAGLTLLGFVRDDRFNIYCGEHRIVCLDQFCANADGKGLEQTV